MTQVTYEGAPFSLGGRDYIVPGLSTRQMRENRDQIARAISLEAKLQDESVDAKREVLESMLDIAVHLTTLALSRNYPNLEKDKVEDWVDMNNVRDLIAAVMGQSGMRLTREVPGVTGTGEP